MEEPGIEAHALYLTVDCRNADARVWTDRSRALAVACIRRSVNRVLVDATDSDPEGHFALRDALTALMLAEATSGLRLALVTNVSRLEAFFDILQRDLHGLNIPARFFACKEQALEWLLRPQAMARPAAWQRA
jgi:hypothetical protein